MLILVGSKDSVKVEAVREAFVKYFGYGFNPFYE